MIIMGNKRSKKAQHEIVGFIVIVVITELDKILEIKFTRKNYENHEKQKIKKPYFQILIIFQKLIQKQLTTGLPIL